ncbi:hypothetical protein M2135_002713 [Parabacteroides sp. PF5-9]|nr:hypothetical protein [Parabacteroides sp. PF5-9]
MRQIYRELEDADCYSQFPTIKKTMAISKKWLIYME